MNFPWYMEALGRAGREVAEQGAITPETADVLARVLIPLEAFLAVANASWDVPGDIAPTLEEAMHENKDNASEKR